MIDAIVMDRGNRGQVVSSALIRIVRVHDAEQTVTAVAVRPNTGSDVVVTWVHSDTLRGRSQSERAPWAEVKRAD